ncbi:FAD/NAD(P)-binding domain-containing protein [Aulographum hederae CBS 113979]|uniref:FAD/NAD(P)-binding domain-containing protein n=1 Tax=Aulographum hederae CBS 113979 TaxID=1176131 RepID=A0A6G1GNR7_9PEZI|nr:FAD/NAD(P)-binding domain-containing protein [Aulographum hederae CBS 113979]
MEKEGVPSFSRVACIGTGLSGVALGAQLKRWYGIDDIKFFDRHGTNGGTWSINQYPGCACDIPSALYSYSFEKNPNWTKRLTPNSEMKAYVDGVVEKHNLRGKMVFATEVKRCVWSDQSQTWTLFVRNVQTGHEYRHQAQILFSAAGQLVEPKPCEIQGHETFKGAIFHSARWNQEANLAGKNVVVIGNGCTAAQIVPSLAPRVKSLTQLIRSKHWICPGTNLNYGAFSRWAFKYIPFALALHRFQIFMLLETDFVSFYMNWLGSWLRKRQRITVEKFMREAGPAKYHDILIPDFDFGCKRRIFDDGYMKSLHRDNVTLSDEKILEIVPDGIKTSRGFVPADVIVLATGFKTNDFLEKVEVVGQKNRTLKEHWADYPGPEAYNCTTMSGFPNFFLLLGPNAATGHTSALMASENTINYALRVSKSVLTGKARSVELKEEAEKKYVYALQAALKGRVWSAGCKTWYVNDNEWNAMAYPWSQAHFWYRSLFPVWSDWTIKRALRRRIAMACHPCRERKARCDGGKPVCSTCQRRGFPQSRCIYQSENSRTASSDAYVHPSVLVPWLEERSATSKSPSQAQSAPEPHSPQDAQGAATRESGEYYGSSSAASLMRLACSSVQSSRRSCSHTSPSTLSSAPLVAISRNVQPNLAFDVCLPPRTLADHLLQRYWDRVHCLYPFIHRPCFQTAYESLWQSSPKPAWQSNGLDVGLGGSSNAGPNSASFNAALNIMFALGCHFADLRPAERSLMAQKFFNRSKRFVGLDFLDENNMGVVQALLMRVLYLQSTPYPSRCWISTGVAYRIAQGLGLHTDSVGPTTTFWEVEMRRRVWHSCVMMDG